jgi:hypothetical protein
MTDDEPKWIEGHIAMWEPAALTRRQTFPEEVEGWRRNAFVVLMEDWERSMREPWEYPDPGFGSKYRLDWWPWLNARPQIRRRAKGVRARLAETWDVLLHGVPEHDCW